MIKKLICFIWGHRYTGWFDNGDGTESLKPVKMCRFCGAKL